MQLYSSKHSCNFIVPLLMLPTGSLEPEKIKNGILNINILHTSASLFVQENASRDVLLDIADFLNDLVPENSKYRHDMEGPDDMPAHIKSLLTNSNLTFSVTNNNILLYSL